MPHPTIADPMLKTSIDLKANGEVSRMRNHKGNMPSLPQTKYCSLCPAKFTRTTHLNRHIRSHTNERSHRCNTCTAEFTRSDLLTRHKRTCGDSNINRSRRKSCQACAESKVKCNLQHPCSKCSARGRECVFINDPEASRNRKIASKRPSRSSASPSECDSSESFCPSSVPSSPLYSPHVTDSFSHLLPPSHLSSPLQSNPVLGFLGHSTSSESSSCSSRSSPQLDYFDARQDPATYHLTFDNLDIDGAGDLQGFFPGAADPFSHEAFSPCAPRVHTDLEFSSWYESNQTVTSAYGAADPTLYSQQEFATGSATLSSPSSPNMARQSFQTVSPVMTSTGTIGFEPTAEDMELYIYLFFSEFNVQVPLFHRPTWRIEATHPIVLRSMQACGAIFAKTQSGSDFVTKTLATSRDSIIAEFSKPSATLKDHMSLLLAVVLLQSIGLLQPRPEQRSISKMYHEMLIMMIRKTCLVKFTGSWPSPDLSNVNMLETTWRDWARYETFKRALALAHIQDCSYSIYYSAAPSFEPTELEICLPCDDSLWRAQSSREWYQIQRTPSPYGTGLPRILGVSMQQAINALRAPSPTIIPYTINPFASLVLVHTILRDIFSPISPALQSQAVGGTFMVQYALHNWQRMWSSSPEAVQSEKLGQGSMPYASNALPFYWLARLSESAKQNGSLIVENTLLSRVDVEERYRTLKSWFVQINDSLHAGVQQMASPSLQSQYQWQTQQQQQQTVTVGAPVFAHH